ncbi:threonine synthase [Sporomusaceae bacterium BoRhaA]|uniref:threonine synthase n=1 Tax=Pelorhabdus rhamnosifermentans TaxID=2772457 RepID=UPI001C05EEFD|nr:threonine synthase [Pelorhabdus rhamnosifermentans]MBU2703169.1 threonine synthase [Pelorhabdus rhamnosifermentans]
MSYVIGLRCVKCSKEFLSSSVDYYCPDCGYHEGILDVLYDYEKISRVLTKEKLQNDSNRSLWRYLPLLPIEQPELLSHLHVGWTPLYEVPRLASALGVQTCYVKDEGRNPTGSFKDRASSIGVIKAQEKKAERITCASTGNAASSLAGFAASQGLPATIFVPQRAPEAKVAQLLIFGAQVFSVQGTYDQAWELCMEASRQFGWYNRNCAINPYLIEGKKTVSLEIAEQFFDQPAEKIPDWVVVAVGDGCTIAGVWKGFKEMHQLGLLQKVPKILGVQAEGCQPFVTAWKNKTDLQPCLEGDTLADSIAVGYPRNFYKGMQAVLESCGAYVAVQDEDILRSMTTLARTAGVFGEPAGVAGVAGILKAKKLGFISSTDSVVLIVTGNGLKDIHSAIIATGSTTKIEPTLEAVTAALKQ